MIAGSLNTSASRQAKLQSNVPTYMSALFGSDGAKLSLAGWMDGSASCSRKKEEVIKDRLESHHLSINIHIIKIRIDLLLSIWDLDYKQNTFFRQRRPKHVYLVMPCQF